MRILFVLEHYYPYVGGAEKLFQVLAESLSKLGHSVQVITSLYDPTLPKNDVVSGVKIKRVNCYNRYLFTLLSIPSIIKLARQAQVIHTTSYNAAFPAWFAAKTTKKPIFITFHEVWGKLWFKLPFTSRFLKTGYYLFEQFILKLDFDRFISVSDFTSRALQDHGIRDDKITRIYNGLEYEHMPNIMYDPPSQFTFTYFGRLGISKGLDLLLPAAKSFKETHPDSKLILVLPRKPRKMAHQISKLIHDLDLKEYINLRHDLTREELYALISKSTCVVIPSYSEGFCFVAAETVALGVPIISSHQGALQEVVSGQYIRMKDMSVDSLYDSLGQAYAAKWSATPIRKFHFSDTINHYIKLYQTFNSI